MSEEAVTGSTIADRYHITGYLRQGRMGDIYVARTTDTNERVAIKLLEPSLFDEPEAVRRFERETRVTATIDHPSSLRVLEYGRSQHGPYLVTEYVTGEILADAIEERGALPTEEAAHIAAQVAMALGAAHAKNIVHRDLAPNNILLASQGDHRNIVKVLDFGLSRLTESDGDDSTLTAVGVRIGTPYYMAPEYIEEYTLDYRADFYGLGVVLFEMLTGEPPFVGRPYKVMDHHVNAQAPAPSSRVEGVPAWLDELVAWLLQKDPEARPQDATAIVEAIEAGLGHPIQLATFRAPPPTPAGAEPRQLVPDEPAPGIDPILARFIDTHTLSVHREEGAAPSRTRCLLVERVAPTSVAGAAGVREGMLLQLPDAPADPPEPRLYRSVVDERHYRFHEADGGVAIDMRTTGIEIGVELMRTPENIDASFDPLQGDPTALLDLWKQGEWERLERLAWRTLTRQSGAAGVLSTGLFAKFLGTDKPKISNHPALLFHGAARLEQGEAGGMERIQEFKVKHSQHWSSIYSAIAHYYVGRDKLEGGATDLGVDILVQGYLQWPLERIGAAIELATGRRPDATPWVGNVLADYSLDTVDRGSSARLYETLQSMDDNQLLCICMLGGYRGNAQYDEFMRRWVNFAAWFSDMLAGLHVITTQTERVSDKPEHYEGEDLCLQAGLNLMILEDYRAFVQRAIKPSVIPTIYLVDKTGTVAHEGQLLSADLWDALALAGTWRMQRHQRRR